MKAMILAAGEGRRLRPLTATTPKPMLKVKGIPLIERLVGQLKTAGITDIVINLFHLGDQIEHFLQDGRRLGVSISYSREAGALETGGGIVQALPLLGDAPFAIVNGDNYTDFDFARLPQDLGPDLAHLVLADRPAWREKGDFVVTRSNDGGCRVQSRGDDQVYCGIAVVTPALFTTPPPTPFSWNVLMFEAVRAGRVSGQIHSGAWLDISTPEQYESVR